MLLFWPQLCSHPLEPEA